MTADTVKNKLTIIIAYKSDEAIYEQIERQIQQAIMAGALKEGDILPSLRQLAQELRISVVTTNRAYEDLQKDGFITIAPGRGAFVAKVSKESLKDKKMKLVEEKLMEAIELAQSYGISRADFQKMIDLLFPRQKHGQNSGNLQSS